MSKFDLGSSIEEFKQLEALKSRIEDNNSKQMGPQRSNFGAASGSSFNAAGVGGGTVGDLYITNKSSGEIVITDNSGRRYTFTGYSNEPLTPEEMEELKRLLEEHELEKKYKRLEEFKKLPPEVRQLYINQVMLHEAVKKINLVPSTMTQSDRLRDLQNKHEKADGIRRRDSWDTTGEAGVSQSLIGLTNEEITEAHTQASLEESILERSNVSEEEK